MAPGDHRQARRVTSALLGQVGQREEGLGGPGRQLLNPQGAHHQRSLVRHPRFTPIYSSRINLGERWFAELTTKWLRRGTHRSVKELTASIRTWIAN